VVPQRGSARAPRPARRPAVLGTGLNGPPTPSSGHRGPRHRLVGRCPAAPTGCGLPTVTTCVSRNTYEVLALVVARQSVARRGDLVEAWFVPTVWTVVVLAAPRLRAERYAVLAVLVENTARAVASTEGVQDDLVRAKVHWTGSDGSTRTGRAVMDSGRKAGSTVTIWFDDEGQPVARRRLDRRRVDGWGSEWDLVEPEWRRRIT